MIRGSDRLLDATRQRQIATLVGFGVGFAVIIWVVAILSHYAN